MQRLIAKLARALHHKLYTNTDCLDVRDTQAQRLLPVLEETVRLIRGYTEIPNHVRADPAPKVTVEELVQHLENKLRFQPVTVPILRPDPAQETSDQLLDQFETQVGEAEAKLQQLQDQVIRYGTRLSAIKDSQRAVRQALTALEYRLEKAASGLTGF